MNNMKVIRRMRERSARRMPRRLFHPHPANE